ncbi:PfaB family protein [Singulisphaera sp. GP187]|uniref:beta-ketoacyl synthase N-terminal-like domain-containing protein n=1 Tax=Singulisphaera sp. GP187 TaxID=1882752 RepID=UPI0009295985|nr:beta-ketoacyl synthase N-terminal-like domain-containing protein [Singulisphaera sp. GP187]SIO57153.1 PfaB family protein [Singulisphaera sp. GP187]
MQHRERVAIVGIGGIFPQSPDLDRFWANVAGGIDTTREVPRGRWLLDVADAYDPRVGAPDRVYSTRGGFIEDFQLDPSGLDLDPAELGRLDPMFHLALHAGRQAWRSAVTTELDRGRVGVVFGNIVLPTETSSALAREVLGRTIAEQVGAVDQIAGRGEPLNGYVAGLPAGVLAKALGLGGGTYTLDAACASSLYALKLAADELLAGRADAMLTGGLSRPDPLYTQMGFSQLRALSASGRPSPFDAQGDGLVVGEGAGMFVLKRLSDALRHGDTIHGVIAAVGLSNDVDGGLLAPSSEGQLRAMRSAYERSGWDPHDVDLIECHATGTPVGDAVEFASLRTLWGTEGWSAGQCTIGSVKSNIGHALTAAGSAGLLKVLFAFKHKTLPPTANFTTPAPSLEEPGSSPFRILSAAQPWPARAEGQPRRAAVSGFGFGGINAHALIEEWVPESAEPVVDAATELPSIPVAIVGMAAHFGPFRGLRAFQERVLGGEVPGAPAELTNWWGVQDAVWFHKEPGEREVLGERGALAPCLPAGSNANDQRQGAYAPRSPLGERNKPRGYGIDELALRPERFRIPPRELEEMLPQQSLALQVAADAIADAGWDDRPRLRAGVFVGIGLDLNTTNFHVRWSMLPSARRWNDELGLNLTGDDLESWITDLRDTAGPPLTANRTMGALGGLVASRIAREFRVGGPSFTVSSEETSGTCALDVAVRLLGQGEIDEAIVGAVDLACDPRTFRCADRVHPFSPSGTVRPLDPNADGTVPSDGAAALIVKRLDDAVRDGDRIYAVIRGVGTSSGADATAYETAAQRAYAASGVDPASVGYLEAHGSGRPDEDQVEAEALAKLGSAWPEKFSCALGSAKGDVGHAGAAAGLASLIKAALCLHQQILPPLRGGETLRPELATAGSPFFVPQGPQFWLRDRARGPRRAAVSALGLEGNCHHIILEGFEPRAGTTTLDRAQPLGPRHLALFAVEADDEPGLLRQMEALEGLAAENQGQPIEALARTWWQRHAADPGRRLGLALLAADAAPGPLAESNRRIAWSLPDLLADARQRLQRDPHEPEPLRLKGDRVFLARHPLGPDAGIAFVFPGVGNHFAGMGRGLSALWPDLLRAQDQETGFLRGQFSPETFWNGDLSEPFADQRAPILGQVSLGAMVSDLLRGFGVEPRATIGYSLGESSALFALRGWTERDEMLRRIQTSPLFRSELAGACEAARRVWGLAEGEPADWLAGIVPHSAETVRAALVGRERVYLLIVNTPREVVVGGRRNDVLDLARTLGGRFFPLPMVSTVHCEITRQVEPAYRAMHLLKTTPPPGVRFYSGARGESYDLDRETAADAIVAHAIDGIDFPAVVAQAYEDGIRVFLETGPGGSCTRMIGKVLGTRPHLSGSVCVAGQDPLTSVLEILGRLIAERVPVNLASLYGVETNVAGEPAGRVIRVSVGGRPFPSCRVGTAHQSSGNLPERHESPPENMPEHHEPLPENMVGHAHPTGNLSERHESPPENMPERFDSSSPARNGHQGTAAVPQLALEIDPLTRQLASSETAKAEAHEAFLRVSGNIGQTMSNQLAFQMALIEALMAEPAAATIASPPIVEEYVPRSEAAQAPAPALDRNQCMEYAIGSIEAVLGPEFAPIDAHPTRVRLPDEPLMLVDRILTIEGEPRSMQGGRVVTEHDVLPGAWYLDGGRIPTCIAVESGQADLFLSGYLGIDFITKGHAVYRLLDAVVTFHRSLPGPGDVIRYDIHIDHFFRQGETHLFRFRFEATVDGVPLMTMSEGCAGFFSANELAAGQGVVAPRLQRQTRPSGRPADWVELVPMAVESYDASQVEALRQGDLATAFGPSFAGLPLHSPTRLPGGRMTLVDRVETLDPKGGRFGLGLIRAEADIQPDDWFMTCHFVDDRVMPGTLMFECCLHTLRIYLARMGWIGEHDQVACEPVPGVASRLKCRGQVIESTRLVTYEVSIKELGYGPEPYAIVDALMYADGKPVVEITDMSLRMTGLSREAIEALWANRPAGTSPAPIQIPSGGEPTPLFDCDRITAFAIGKPSDAFGVPYKIFDSGRVIARLPGPPFQFLDRITAIAAEPWKHVAGGVIEARYDVPADAWYFAAERQGRMPFAVLLEAALQPCGWLAAYIGSALTSEEDLKFRNLGGSAVQFVEVTPATGTLVTTIKITKVAGSGGMIIQNYDLEVRAANGQLVYQGDTYFGFFRAEALAEQIGIRDPALYQPSPDERARAQQLAYPRTPPFPDDQLRMIDQVDCFIPDGGPAGLGFIEGSQNVDPGAWYFKAHFHQDPVCPGSLGLESFRQLLKVVAAERWGVGSDASFVDAAPDVPHRWTYRGQVLPTAGRVVVQATITKVDDQRRRLWANGFLTVDGRTIFQMNDFTLGLNS